jgi:hypothetical protein
LYVAWDRLGLIGDALILKVSEFVERVVHGPVLGVLESPDNILTSLKAVLSQLEPVEEFKKALKTRIEFGPDQEIICFEMLHFVTSVSLQAASPGKSTCGQERLRGSQSAPCHLVLSVLSFYAEGNSRIRFVTVDPSVDAGYGSESAIPTNLGVSKPALNLSGSRET